jgi:23S rRNA (guanosine2251-2'-O)-methyltransferase
MKPIVAILANIRSIHNVASMFRTADGAGIEKLYLVGVTPTPLNQLGKISEPFHKVALGAEETVKWQQAKTIAPLIRKLKKDGYYIVAVEQAEKAIELESAEFKKIKKENTKIALIMGEEVEGISHSILKLCDAVIEIPMRGKKESLNVSVAFGIAAYAVTR